MHSDGATFALSGSPVSLESYWPPPLPQTVRQLLERDEGAWRRRLIQNLTVVNRPQTSLWERVALAATAEGELRLTVLGSSVSNGCGGCDFASLEDTSFGLQKEELHPFPACSVGGRFHPMLCRPDFSWVRVMHDDLAHSLHRTQGTRLRTNLVAKNAVGPAFFESCTSSRWEQYAHRAHRSGNQPLQRRPRAAGVALREVAPHAVVALIAWVKRSECSLAHANINTMRDLGNADADVMRADAILMHMTEPLQRSPAVLYASHGRDAVHPNPLSHWLLGGAAANFVREQLRQHSQGARPSTTVIKQAPRARVFERCSRMPHSSRGPAQTTRTTLRGDLWMRAPPPARA